MSDQHHHFSHGPGAFAPPTNPCVCCRTSPHAFYPDRDLDGFCCADCTTLLFGAKIILRAHGLPRVARAPDTPHRRFPLS